MKYLKYILCVLIMLPLALPAQNIKNLSKKYIGKIDVAEEGGINAYVKHGEFKLDFDNTVTDSYNYLYTQNNKYIVIVRDSKDNIVYMKNNNYELAFKNMKAVKILRAGYAINECVYVEKRNITYTGESQYRYYLHVAGLSLGPYDEILDLFPDGFIYRLGEKYAYKTYSNDDENQVVYQIPTEALYVEKTIRCNLRDTVLDFKPTENVRYYTTSEGHYYLLYYDNYMENTLMVVDSTGYELDGAMETVDFKYSKDGKHWIAAYTNNLVVDGVNVARLTDKIKHVAIKNDGQYAYVVEGKNMNDKYYVDNKLVLQGVDMKWLAVDAEERLHYICRNPKGYFYGIDNEMVSKDHDMKEYYYPALFDSDEKFVVKSRDGQHVMEYSYDTPYIMIDNRRLDCPSIPHYAKWDDSEHCFYWNAVEGINLYLYKYKVKK